MAACEDRMDFGVFTVRPRAATVSCGFVVSQKRWIVVEVLNVAMHAWLASRF